MNKLIFALLLLSFSRIHCYGQTKLSKCISCTDRECVAELANKIAKKKLRNKLEHFEMKIEEEVAYYVVSYANVETRKDPLKKGGGIMFKIAKKDCKVVDFKRFK